jgi:hypothetical protein
MPIMFHATRSRQRRNLRLAVDSLEGRALLNGAMPLQVFEPSSPAVMAGGKGHHGPGGAVPVSIPNMTSSNGYQFINLDGPNAGTNAGAGTNLNGIANNGTAVGFTIDNDGNLHNFTTNPRKGRTATATMLNINGSMNAMAFGVNSGGTVVGTDGNGNAFTLSKGGTLKTFIPNGGMSATAFGINDGGTIVGQYVTGNATPGFIQENDNTVITINAPTGPNTVFAQGINNHGLVVAYYLGTDGQDHGFMANEKDAQNGVLTGTAIADPTIPSSVKGEPGATFMFSQILAVNDQGIAVGYYGDSTMSQHGFLYNTKTGAYTFLDDPSEAFNNSGVEVTQITGITNSGEITGFYSDANGVFHGFVATTH